MRTHDALAFRNSLTQVEEDSILGHESYGNEKMDSVNRALDLEEELTCSVSKNRLVPVRHWEDALQPFAQHDSFYYYFEPF